MSKLGFIQILLLMHPCCCLPSCYSTSSYRVANNSHNTRGLIGTEQRCALCAPSSPQMLPVTLYIWFQRATLLPLITPNTYMATAGKPCVLPEKSPESQLSRDYLRALDPAEQHGDGLMVTDAHRRRLFS